MTWGVSVIICCYNSASRLPETLRHLALQENTEGIPWEVVIVDNASTDNTASTANACWPGTAPAPLRFVSESQAGLSHARIRGILEARHEIISFIDDDNWAAPDWIVRVSTFFAKNPGLGALGGRIEAVCEITEPVWFAGLQQHYAVGRQYERTGEITWSTGTLLCGAGLNLRTASVRQLFQRGFVPLMIDRKGQALSSGGDTELCFALRQMGCRFWYDDDLRLRHFIPQGRLTWNYIIRLKRGFGEVSTLFVLYLCALNAPPFDSYPAWKKNWIFQTLKAHWNLAQLIWAHPAACLGQREGYLPSLDYEELKSRAAAMWSLLGRYRQIERRIQNSAWVHNHNHSPSSG